MAAIDGNGIEVMLQPDGAKGALRVATNRHSNVLDERAVGWDLEADAS